MKRHPATLLLVTALVSCGTPSDVLYDAPEFTPVEDRDGRLQVTFGPGPAVARGFLPDGRLLFRALDLPPFAGGWVLVSVPPAGGGLQQEVGGYREALPDPQSDLRIGEERRALVLWRDAISGVHGCPDSAQQSRYLLDPDNVVPVPAPASPVQFTVYRLPPEDGTAISHLPFRAIETQGVVGVGTDVQRVRITPTLRDVNATGTNAFGPELVPGTDSLVFSDGDRLWLASLTDTGAPPALLGVGSYPSFDRDGRALAFARPVGVDSLTQVFSVPLPMGICLQEHVQISATSWEIVIRDWMTGAERVVAEGLDPAFDPLEPRLVVRQGGALAWIDLVSGGVTPIPATEGAFDPAVSPDGALLAFSLFTSPGNSNVYFLRIRG